MVRTNKTAFPSTSFAKRLNSMVKVDSRRMFTSPLFYICFGIALVVPILILVMTTMTGGSAMTDPHMGMAAEAFAFTNAWQIIASESGAGTAGMDMVSMCNINLMYLWQASFSAFSCHRIFQADTQKICSPSVREKGTMWRPKRC